jgi:hypothetical protein
MKKITFENLPSTKTPVNSSNLNQVQNNIENVFNGEESMGSIVVEDVTCKNLCNGIRQGYYLTIAGTSFGRTATDNGLVIEVEENTDYTISTTDIQTRYRIAFTNTLLSIGSSSSDTYNALTKDGTKESITRNSGTYKYLIVDAADPLKIQVEKGEVASKFVPHKEFNNKQIYSTNEQVIGTWIDGKPLYRKVVDCGALPNNTTKTVPSGISNVADMVKISGFSKDASGGCLPMPFVSTTSPVAVSYNASNNQISITTSQNRTNYISTSIILEYTKTTDATSTAQLEE